MARRAKRGDRTRRVGVISDTHGLARPQALAALAGSELIVHAGDVGSPEVLAALAAIAPVAAIRGNNDVDAWARALPETRVVEVGDARLYVLHSIGDLDRDLARDGFVAVIAGHSHRPSIGHRDGVLFVNPGSAGPRRFTLPVAVARLTVSAARTIEGEIVTLAV
ncbi:MAG: metallophosphoesterase family protein [Deltaproteobacteria bacterium]|jgi:putative phosphoesterase|nr:metallophosphoesterase family protein [Deltaproteobacteria bacterium]